MIDPDDKQFDDRQFDQQPEEEQEQGISLEGLSEAFAEAIGKSAKSPKAPPKPADDQAAAEAAESDVADNDAAERRPFARACKPDGFDSDDADFDESDLDAVAADGLSEEDDGTPEETGELPSSFSDELDEDPCPIGPRTIFEAMLFVGNPDNRPLESRRAAELMRGVEAEEIPSIVDQLNSRYAANGCPYFIAAEGSGYRLTLTKSFHALRDKFYGRIREVRLSQAAVDVLSIVAYRQPMTSDDISRLRGKPCAHILTQLVRRRLVKIERPADNPRKAVYRTTDRFLALFGLESIGELPQSEDVSTS